MSIADKIPRKKRALFETANDGLKNIVQTEHSRHRSVSCLPENHIQNSIFIFPSLFCFI